MRFIAFLIISAVAAGSASAQTSQTRKNQPEVICSVSGTVIQPTRTIIHNSNGTTTIITVPRRSYLNPGTEVPVGYGQPHGLRLPAGRRSRTPVLVLRARSGWHRRCCCWRNRTSSPATIQITHTYLLRWIGCDWSAAIGWARAGPAADATLRAAPARRRPLRPSPRC